MVTCFRIIALLLILGTLGISNSFAKENNMALSLEKQLIRDEGMSLEVYLDHLGKPTVGVGHLVLPQDKLKVGDKISHSRALQLFRKDIKTSQRDAAIFVGADTFKGMSKDMQNVVTNMAFNLGATRLGKFNKFKAALQKGDYKEAAKEMKDSKWYKQVPNRAERLISVVMDEAMAIEKDQMIFIEAYTRADGIRIPAHYRKKA